MVTPVEEVHRLRGEVAARRAQVVWLKLQLFGHGRSETLNGRQVLRHPVEPKKPATAHRPTEIITYERAGEPAPQRTLPAESFAHLPLKETVEIVPEAVRAGADVHARIGEERTFEVEVIPPQLFRREIVCPKYWRCLDPTIGPRCSHLRRNGL